MKEVSPLQVSEQRIVQDFVRQVTFTLKLFGCSNLSIFCERLYVAFRTMPFLAVYAAKDFVNY